MKDQKSTATDKVDIFMPFYIGDYLKDTKRLAPLEHCAYLLLMFDYWQSGPLPDNPTVLARAAQMSVEEWGDASSNVLAYFKLKDGKHHHSRIDRELEKARARKAGNIKRAKAGAEGRWGKKSETSPDASSNASSSSQAMLESCPSPSPSHTHSNTESKPTSKSEVVGATTPSFSTQCAEMVLKLNPTDKHSTVESIKAVFDKHPREAQKSVITDMGTNYKLGRQASVPNALKRTENYFSNVRPPKEEYVARVAGGAKIYDL